VFLIAYGKYINESIKTQIILADIYGLKIVLTFLLHQLLSERTLFKYHVLTEQDKTTVTQNSPSKLELGLLLAKNKTILAANINQPGI